MIDIKLIRIVAGIEAKIFARSWIFRFLVLIIFIILGFFNWFLFILMANQGAQWMWRSIPSSIPYLNFLFLTVLEIPIVIFGAVESMQREFSLDTADSIHTRSFTNFSYITGKMIGIMMPCLIINLIVIVLALVVTGVFVADVPVVWHVYILYPILLSFPALLLMTSLSFAVMSVFRNKPFSMLILIGSYILSITYGDGILARLLDFMGVHLPVLHSSIVGLDNWRSILAQRSVFLFSALGCIFVTGIFFKRLPQAAKSRYLSLKFTIIFIVAAIISGVIYTSDINSGIKLRTHIQSLNEEYASKVRARLTKCNLDIVHKGSKFEVDATLTLYNSREEQINTVYLSLNPGFKVSSVTSDGIELDFERNTQMLDITLKAPLIPDTEKVIIVRYEGRVNEEACYPDIDSDERIKVNRMDFYKINKRYGFISKDYVLLTPECLWYPVSGVPYGMVFLSPNEKDFIDFTVDISTGDNLTVISQGAVKKTGIGKFTVRPETKLYGLTLSAGEYEKRSVIADSVEIALFHRPGHDYYSRNFKSDTEVIINAIEKAKQDIEYKKGMKYPYVRLNIVESPVQFHAYERPWTTYMETGQPQMLIVPEKGFFIEELDISMIRRSFARSRNPVVDWDEDALSAEVIEYIVNSVFVSDSVQRRRSRDIRKNQSTGIQQRMVNYQNFHYIPGYTISAQFYPFLMSFESEKYPKFDTIMEFYRKHGLNFNLQTDFGRGRTSSLRDEEIICMALEQKSFAEFIENGADFDTMNQLFMLKANQLFGGIEADVGKDEFEEFLNTFIAEHAFENVKFEEFEVAVEKTFGLDMNKRLESLFNETQLPMFEVQDVLMTEIIDGDFTCYQTTFTVTNTEPVSGTVWFQLMYSGDDSSADRTSRFVNFEGNQTKEIGFITGVQPDFMGVNTIISKNIPILFNNRFSEPRVDHTLNPFEGERVIAYSPVTQKPGTIIVDNLDEGFEILSAPKQDSENKKYDEIYHMNNSSEGYMAFLPGFPPQRWGKVVFSKSYGQKATALYTRYGDGEGCVAWSADIPEPGNYDLEYFIAKFGDSAYYAYGYPLSESDSKRPLFGEYNLSVIHDGLNNSITFKPNGMQPGWQYVSSFDLNQGEVKVELSNKSTGLLIYADAVRWVKRK